LLVKARDEEASRRGMKPEMVAVDPSTVDLSEAERHLATAVRFGPHLWRAHFLLGRVYLAAGRARAAAESFTTSALRGAPEPAPWLQLGELYRSWDFHDHAIRVAEQGMAVVVSDSDKADLAHLAGVALEAKNQDTQAIAKFSRALELRTDHAQAQFMRGQTYWKIRDFAKAKPDLEAVAKPGRIPGFFHQQAVRMLAEMAKK
jgi:tetratricopeptide (TPR) repeat protein